MEIDQTVRDNAKWLMLVLPALIGLYIFGEGTIFTYKFPEWAVYILLLGSWYIMNLQRKDILHIINSKENKKEEKEVEDKEEPFSADLGGYKK